MLEWSNLGLVIEGSSALGPAGRGAEYNKWSARVTPKHDVTLAFTRMLAGPMHYTPGGFNNVTREEFVPRGRAPMVMSEPAGSEAPKRLTRALTPRS